MGKVLITQYDLIILSHKLTNGKNDAVWFLKQLERKQPKKLDIPFLISTATEYDVEEIEKILKGKRLKYIDKDSENYLYEMEWAILNFVPKVFHVYRKNIEISIATHQIVRKHIENLGEKVESIDKQDKAAIDSLSRKSEYNTGEIDKNRFEINEIQDELKEKYVRWRDITESLGVIVGAFSLVVGIIVSLIVFLLKLGNIEKFKVSWILILGLFLVLFVLWGIVHYLYIKKWSKKKIEEEIRKRFREMERLSETKTSGLHRKSEKRNGNV